MCSRLTMLLSLRLCRIVSKDVKIRGSKNKDAPICSAQLMKLHAMKMSFYRSHCVYWLINSYRQASDNLFMNKRIQRTDLAN